MILRTRDIDIQLAGCCIMETPIGHRYIPRAKSVWRQLGDFRSFLVRIYNYVIRTVSIYKPGHAISLYYLLQRIKGRVERVNPVKYFKSANDNMYFDTPYDTNQEHYLSCDTARRYCLRPSLPRMAFRPQSTDIRRIVTGINDTLLLLVCIYRDGTFVCAAS